jgi:mono/diheme cytochrome c family protein
MRKGIGAAILVAVAAAVAAGIYWWAGNTAPSGVADPTDADQVARGRLVYEQHCMTCHGERLEGQANWQTRMANGRLPAPPHDETGHTWHHPDAMLFTVTKEGPQALAGPDYPSDMPAFADRMTDADIWAVIAYIKSRWPGEILARQETINRRYSDSQ